MTSPVSDDAAGSAADDGALFLIVRIKPRRDQLTEAAAQLHRMRRAALEEPGCVFMHLVEAVDDASDTWVMIEQFRSRAAWDEHMASEHNQRGNQDLEPLLREPSELVLYRVKE